MTVPSLPALTPLPTTATLGLDLTALGVHERGPMFADLPVATADLPRLVSYTRAAHDGGIDFVALGPDFRARSDEEARREAWLDPVVTARRLGPHAAAGVVASVPASADLAPVAAELTRVRTAPGAWTGLQLTEHGEPGDLVRALGELRAILTRPAPPPLIAAAGSERALEAGARFADAVRIRERDPSWAREVRYAVRAAARAAGRQDVRVLVDLHVVVAADRTSAEARAELVADIDGPDATDGLTVVGTAADVVDLIHAWVEAGAADGFVIVPGSLRADVQPLLREVVPELRARGLLAPHRPSAPRPSTAGTAPHRPARHRLVKESVA